VVGVTANYGAGAVFEQHAAKLRASAVSPEVAAERGYVSADTKAQLERYGFSQAQRLVPALIIPLRDVIGQNGGHQLRPDSPRVLRGRIVKYETKMGQAMQLDVPRRVQPRLGNPAVPLIITEGPIKADAAVSAGLCCIALLGVWSWRGKNEDGGKVALPDWEYLALNGRTVYVCFDSDAMLKPQVHGAMARLGRFLGHRGADVAYIYLPAGAYGAKVGLDDYLAAGHTTDELFAHATNKLPGHPSNSSATVQPPPATAPPEPPKLASDQHILDRFKDEVRLHGLVGEECNAATLFLVLTSRVLDKQASAGVKGHSSSGKSYLVETVTEFFPPEAVFVMTAMSQHALIYSEEDYRHRTLVMYEVVALREGVEDDLTSYLVRSLLSEGRIKYPVTVRDDDGGFTAKTIVKEGPTNLVFTTTKPQVHAENETRILSLNTDDSREQTHRVLLELANEADKGNDLGEWRQLQAWLATAEHRVTIPYARTLAELIPPVAVRLRRDFGAVLALIRAHAVLHQLTRDRDDYGQIVATLDDYDAVRDLISEAVSEGVGATVSDTIRETVTAVAEMKEPDGVTASAVAERLNLDKSAASRRLFDVECCGRTWRGRPPLGEA
jgi:Domain of unknown function (DUF3854)